MRHILRAAALSCAFLSFARADAPADGLYIGTDDSEAPTVSGLGLGKACRYEILEARLDSRDNLNREFHLSLTLPFSKDLGTMWHVLVVGGNAWPAIGAGSDADRTSSMSFSVSGREEAEAVAEYFRIKPRLRAHPGHQLSVSFVPTREAFETGGAAVTTLRIANLGAKSVFFQDGGRNRAARDNQFVFRATDGDKALPDIGSDAHLGGLSVIRELKPGEVFEKEIDLAKWFAFGKPGVVSVHGSFLLEFFESREAGHVVWEDWGTAAFEVRIREKGK
ncbi:MAG: hypothetical protein HUU15_15240 [Candidatus Brocadiae bacterium]|nr:hypothetical protein [Candidatus Brocadiia bacterium]